jgi:hypothetical protein
MAALIPSRCLRIVRPALTNSGMRLRLRAGAPAIQQTPDGVGAQVAGEDRAQSLFQLVRAPEEPAGSFQLSQCLGLCLGEVRRILEQNPAGTLEGLRDRLVR